MTRNRWLQIMTLGLTIAALSTRAQAQGKGKGQSVAKAEHKQEQSVAKAEHQQAQGAAKPQNPGKTKEYVTPQAARQSARSEGNGRSRAGINYEAPTVAEHGNSRGNGANKVVPVAPNASPRAVVAASGAPRGHAYGRFGRDLTVGEIRPSMQRYVSSTRPAELVSGGAVAYALARGIPENALIIAPSSNDIWIRNRRGDALVAIDDDRARNLGVWQVSPLAEPVKQGAPSFCRSGEGHPVWGRQWCLQKGFGLGDQSDYQWAAARDVGDVVFTRPVVGPLNRDALYNLLGQVAFDRLALHALTLGYSDPLTGVWRTDPGNPGVLLVNSGRLPVAELVDENGDQRPELMLVALKPW